MISVPEDDAHLREQPTGRRDEISKRWLHVVCDEVRLPDGQLATREFILHPGAVAVVPLLDDGRVVMVRQWRYPVGKLLLELPAGRREGAEDTLLCAQRELAEETGYTASEWALATEIHNAAAYADESIWIWFARGLVPGPQRLDEGEFVEVVTHTDAELDAMQAAGQLPDVKTIVGLHILQRWRAGARQLTWQRVTA